MALGTSAVLVVGAISVGAAYASTRQAAPLAPGTARLIAGDAAVTVHRQLPDVAADAPLRQGDSLRVTRGVAVVQTPAGKLLARPGTTIAFTRTLPRVERGDVLVMGKGVDVATQTATAVVNGAVRLRQGLSLEVGVYRGTAGVRTAADALRVPRLRRAVITGIGAAATGRVVPLVIDAADDWDREFLQEAIELDAALNARSRGLTMQAAGGNSVTGNLLNAAGWRQLSALVDQPVGEIVVAAELAKAAHLGRNAVTAALQLREAGAAWGLIAYEQGIKVPPAALPGIDDIAVPVLDQPIVNPSKTVVVPTPTTLPAGQPTNTTTPPKKPVVGIPTTPTTLVPAQDPPVADPLGGLVRGLGSVLNGLLGGN